ncbi:MAG: ABC transporter ATP-binding protein [Anaerolineales bacterium]|nr:MAG: ABC transporter ATP-binding protein [Anaerolineales bacterium]
MAHLTASNLSKYFGVNDIFTGISLELHEGECVALVGANGCGKSTLLDILAGKIEPDSGNVYKARDIRLGYLPQVPDLLEEGTLWQSMEAVFADLLAQQAELHRLEAMMASQDEAEMMYAMERYGEKQEAFEQGGGFTYESRIRQVLGGLGFEKDALQMPVSYLSGGEKTRALLARLLLEAPDVLLLDEPTNHLDLNGIEWLEDQLRGWKGTILIVAHDRAFLDAVSVRVLEMERGQLEMYRGNYTAYMQQRSDRITRREAEYKAQQQHIAATEDYIRRYMAGQRTSQAKGRLRRLNRLERLAYMPKKSQVHLNLQTTLRSGDLVLGLYDLSAGYEKDAPLVSIEEAEIHRGHCVALVGPNGSGKTTLLRTILHQLRPLQGRVRIGSAVRLGYFAQVQDSLIAGKSILETIMNSGINSLAETRSILARYGFRGDDVFKLVNILSGGERARVSLALLAQQKANFLLLDEPTNHLDIQSQEVLQDVITDFNGTILMVSHDRYLIREVATQVWALADNQIYIFDDGYPAYDTWHQNRRTTPQKNQPGKDETQAIRDRERLAQRTEKRELARRQEHLETLEAQIHQHEAQMQELTTSLGAAGRAQDVGRVSKLGAEYHRVEAEINRLLEEWSKIADTPTP